MDKVIRDIQRTILSECSLLIVVLIDESMILVIRNISSGDIFQNKNVLDLEKLKLSI
jgi:hypothetical protein